MVLTHSGIVAYVKDFLHLVLGSTQVKSLLKTKLPPSLSMHHDDNGHNALKALCGP